MRRFALILLAVGLLALAIFTAVEGYRNYRLFVCSFGTVETNIRLDVPGTFAVTVNPPGRSLFRPGGVLEIWVSRQGVPLSVERVPLGRGKLRVTDCARRLCLEQPLDELGVTYRGGKQYYSPREFDISGGGPYRVDFEITEPFLHLEGTSQTLVARHFVCGNEAWLHFIQLGVAGLSGGVGLLLVSVILLKWIKRSSPSCQPGTPEDRVRAAPEQ